MDTPINTPCYIIVGGIEKNEGIVIVRDRNGTNYTSTLSDENWFVVATNTDFWTKNDPRYEKALN